MGMCASVCRTNDRGENGRIIREGRERERERNKKICWAQPNVWMAREIAFVHATSRDGFLNTYCAPLAGPVEPILKEYSTGGSE